MSIQGKDVLMNILLSEIKQGLNDLRLNEWHYIKCYIKLSMKLVILSKYAHYLSLHGGWGAAKGINDIIIFLNKDRN